MTKQRSRIGRQLEASVAVIDRQKTHGKFQDHARASQGLKEVLRRQEGWAGLDDDMREALDMIMHKAARAVTGDPSHRDHWADIQGYAARISERLAGEGK